MREMIFEKRFLNGVRKMKGHALTNIFELYDSNQGYSCDSNQVLKILWKTSVDLNQVRCDLNQTNQWVSHKN